MTIKEELKKEVKEDGGGEDELEALDALEREAAEYNKVCFRSSLSGIWTADQVTHLGC